MADYSRLTLEDFLEMFLGHGGSKRLRKLDIPVDAEFTTIFRAIQTAWISGVNVEAVPIISLLSSIVFLGGGGCPTL